MSDVSLAELAGHDRDAQQQLAGLLDRYRREGLAGVRAKIAADLIDGVSTPADQDALLVEAVLTIAEQQSRPLTRRRDWEDFDREEQRGDDEREARGGGA